jgi:hypothetical protein
VQSRSEDGELDRRTGRGLNDLEEQGAQLDRMWEEGERRKPSTDMTYLESPKAPRTRNSTSIVGYASMGAMVLKTL